MTNPLALALSQLTPVLEALGIRYVVVGSLASSSQGIYRATIDGDLLALLPTGQARRLAAVLGRNWSADADMMDRAVRDGRSFNIIHIPTAQKIDIFPVTNDFHATQLERAREIPLFPDEREMRFPVATPEDVLLAKLVWFREGGEVSEQQWRDLTGVIAINQDLDLDYARSWAVRLRVEDLLDKALAEVAAEE
jgi:hypothetical protein